MYITILFEKSGYKIVNNLSFLDIIYIFIFVKEFNTKNQAYKLTISVASIKRIWKLIVNSEVVYPYIDLL